MNESIQLPRTSTLTLILQRVDVDDANARALLVAALREYATDVELGHALNGVYERHHNEGVRIDAVASMPAIMGREAAEGPVAEDADGALRARVQDLAQLALYLPGGPRADEIGAALGYTPEQAGNAIRDKVGEIAGGLGIDIVDTEADDHE